MRFCALFLSTKFWLCLVAFCCCGRTIATADLFDAAVDTCTDDPTWVWINRKGKRRGCSWVAAKPNQRCTANRIGTNRQSVLDACPSACRQCTETAPTQPRTDSAQCENNVRWYYTNPRGRKVSCRFFARNPRKRCRATYVGLFGQNPLEACPLACNSCSNTPNTLPTTTTVRATSATTSTIAAETTTMTTTSTELSAPFKSPSQVLVDRLDFDQFKENIKTLSNFGDRTQGSRSYDNAEAWVKQQLLGFGYDRVEHDSFTHRTRNYRNSYRRRNMWVTKVGTKHPDQMYIVSAHLDGRGGGGAANDDGSGCALVLEMARVFASPDVATDVSIRFIFWNAEETGLNGAYAYVQNRRAMQGKPDKSGYYPEPTWLGMITHDQILYDHGTPAQKDQDPNADADIEYVASSRQASSSKALGQALLQGNSAYAVTYPAELSGDMCCTDSYAFIQDCPSVSIRENRRRAEMGQGNAAPHWHQRTDVWSTYSDADYEFGMDIVRMSTGTVSDLSKAQIV